MHSCTQKDFPCLYHLNQSGVFWNSSLRFSVNTESMLLWWLLGSNVYQMIQFSCSLTTRRWFFMAWWLFVVLWTTGYLKKKNKKKAAIYFPNKRCTAQQLQTFPRAKIVLFVSKFALSVASASAPSIVINLLSLLSGHCLIQASTISLCSN